TRRRDQGGGRGDREGPPGRWLLQQVVTMLIARLHPPERKEGVRYNGLYCVEFDGELIVVDSRDPEHDLARALLARGLTGKVTMLDAPTGERGCMKHSRSGRLPIVADAHRLG